MKLLLKKILKKTRIGLAVTIRCTGVFIIGIDCILMTLIRGKRCKPDPQPDKDVVLLGNGPSLAELDLRRIAEKYDIACVNWFAIKDRDMFFGIKPRYYFLIDPAFFGIGIEERSQEQIAQNQESINELKGVFNSIDWNMTIITPQSCTFGIINKHVTEEELSTQAICSDYLEYYQYLLHKHNFATCGMQNVLCGALHYFIMNKFRTVYMSGADMSEFKAHTIDERNHIFCCSPHFYETELTDRTEAGGIPIGDFYKHLGYYAKMLKEFHYLRIFADRQNVKIINLSQQSFIDSFDKMSWEKLLS